MATRLRVCNGHFITELLLLHSCSTWQESPEQPSSQPAAELRQQSRPRDPKTVKLETFNFCAALPVNFPGLKACLAAFFIP